MKGLVRKAGEVNERPTELPLSRCRRDPLVAGEKAKTETRSEPLTDVARQADSFS
jgi:hypothetical protein